MQLRVLDHQLVWEPPPDSNLHYLSEPRFARTRAGSIVLSHRCGTTRSSGDGTTHFLTSSDDGASWTDLGYPFLGDQPGQDLRIATLAETANDDLVSVVMAIDCSRPDRSNFNPETSGAVPLQNLVTRSRDGGRSWDRLQPLIGSPFPQTSIVDMTSLDNDLICTFETFKEYDDPGPWSYRAGIIRSSDEGHTWGNVSVCASLGADQTMWWDPRIAALSNGGLVVFYYAYESGSGLDRPVHVNWSRDRGHTWSEPVSTGLRGQATYPIHLGNDHLIAFQQRRHPPQCIAAIYSPDGGRTLQAETVVYEHHGRSAPAADGTLSPIEYLASMGLFTFGHPCGVALDPTHVLLAWYAGNESASAIYSARVEISA